MMTTQISPRPVASGLKGLPALLLSGVLALTAIAKAPQARAHDVAGAMADTATQFLSSLDDAQKAKATYALNDEERKNWHFIPRERNGLPLKDMRPDQQHLAQALLSSGMSHRGYATALTIMSLEQILWEIENHSAKRDPANYYFTIFGEPGGDKNWGWRVEGHHLSLNFTIAGGQLVAGTPNFFAANPGEVKEGPRKGLRVLAEEEDQGRALIKSLDEAQRKKAIIADKSPKEVITEAEPKVGPLPEEGIKASDLTAGQQAALHTLVELYINRLRSELAGEKLKEIEDAGFENLLFAWAGGLEMGEGHYYRIQGSSFLIEYVNTQNGGYHPHAVWRDFNGDFGEDILAKHLSASPH